MKMPRRGTVWAIGLATLGLAALITRGRFGAQIPVVSAEQGDWVDYVELRGDVQTRRSISLTAPADASDPQILTIVPTGTTVRPGDIIVQFDSTQYRRTLDLARARYREAASEGERLLAQQRMESEQTRTDLVDSEYDLARARLETRRQEVLSEIEGQKNRLALADAELRLNETQARTKSASVHSAVELRRLFRRRRRLAAEIQEAERAVAAMTLRASVGGMVTLLPNPRARTGRGGDAPDFKPGDRAWPGAAVAQLPDLSSVLVNTRVDEADRGRLSAGQKAVVLVDALPDREFQARVAEISVLAQSDFSAGATTRSFDVTLALDATDPRLRPGMSASGRVVVGRVAGSIVIPASACVERSGRTVVYVLRRWTFEERVIQVARSSPRQVAVAQGLKPGERVAIRDPFPPRDAERE